MAINKYLLIITLNVNGLNAPIIRHRGEELKKKQKSSVGCLQETHLRAYRLKVRGWDKIFHANGQDSKSGVAIVISDKIDVKTKVKKTKKDTI